MVCRVATCPRARLNLDVFPGPFGTSDMQPTPADSLPLFKLGGRLVSRGLVGRLLAFATGCSIFHGQAGAQNPLQPAVNPLAPLSYPRGQGFDLNLAGTQLAQPSGLMLSFPAQVSFPPENKNGTEPARLLARVQPRPDTPAGLHVARLATRLGVGPDRLLWLDDLPGLQALPAARNKATPQVITLPALVQGRVDAEQADWFRFRAEARQTLVFEVIGRRLGSAVDPQITLFDAVGRELKKGHANDAPGLQSDPRLVFTFPVAGEFVVQVRDTAWQGGADFHYLLRVADCPAATCAVPLAIRRGSKALVGFAGPRVDGLAPLEVQAPSDPFLSAIRVTPRGLTGQPGTPVEVQLSDLNELVEQEPNDTADKAQKLPGACGMTGRIEKRGDIDRYSFKASKDQRWIIEAKTIELGSPAEVLLTVFDAKGAKLAETNPTAAARLDWKAPADGDFQVQVEHLHLWGGPDEVYRVTLEPFAAGFTLALQADRFEVRRDGSVEIPVLVTRQDYAGPIEISAQGPLGITGTLSIAAGQPAKPAEPAGSLRLTCPGNLPLGIHPLVVLGTADVAGVRLARAASVLGPIRAGMANLSRLPTAWESQAALAVIEKAPFQITARLEPVTPVAPGKETVLVVTVQRQSDFQGEVVLSVAGLPANVTTAAVPIIKDKTEARFPVKAAANAAEGKASLVVTGKGKIADKELGFNAGAVELTIKK